MLEVHAYSILKAHDCSIIEGHDYSIIEVDDHSLIEVYDYSIVEVQLLQIAFNQTVWKCCLFGRKRTCAAVVTGSNVPSI